MEYNETLQEELVRLSDELEEQTLRLRHEICLLYTSPSPRD